MSYQCKIVILYTEMMLVVCITCVIYNRNWLLHFRIDWIEWQGNKHQVGDFIWYGYQDGLPRFGKL